MNLSCHITSRFEGSPRTQEEKGESDSSYAPCAHVGNRRRVQGRAPASVDVEAYQNGHATYAWFDAKAVAVECTIRAAFRKWTCYRFPEIDPAKIVSMLC